MNFLKGTGIRQSIHTAPYCKAIWTPFKVYKALSDIGQWKLLNSPAGGANPPYKCC